ncbi:hypothetical protein BC826DRAFT_655248 [Russula brevipes]|nr:hypothetical protein BC826DRAFT_655248 [Russula brevipes]
MEYDKCAQVELSLFGAQFGVQPNSPPHETQLHAIGGRLTTLRTGGRSGRNLDHKIRPVCIYCKKSFGRAQELKRHTRDVHMPRRRCPFCGRFSWSRPDKIKAHLIAKHRQNFISELLDRVKALQGRDIVEFVNTYDHGIVGQHSIL